MLTASGWVCSVLFYLIWLIGLAVHMKGAGPGGALNVAFQSQFQGSPLQTERRNLSTCCPYAHLGNRLTGRCSDSRSPKRANTDNLAGLPVHSLSICLYLSIPLDSPDGVWVWVCACVCLKSEFMPRCCNNWCWKMMAMTKWLLRSA